MSAPANSLNMPRPNAAFFVALACVAALLWLFRDALAEMLDVWLSREEYSHGILIPLIAAVLAWRKRDEMAQVPWRGSWWGVGLILFALGLHLLGQLASVFVLQQYALLLCLYALVAALGGRRLMRVLWAPLLLLFLMIPLPNFLLNNFSSQLQLLSSQLGVAFIRLFGISVFVEGNVIDLGSYRLQVAEACDGLRYLFPLMTLGFIMAYFFQVAMWKRVVLFVSSIPITLFMNSLRIGTIGVMVEHWGTRMAEGFLHDFQGWAVFMASAAIMLGEMMLLARIGRDARPWREVFGLDFPPPPQRDAARTASAMPQPFIASGVLLMLFTAGVAVVPERAEAVPGRESFVSFPIQVAEWTGHRAALEQVYLETLQLDDYVMADYVRDGKDAVSLYAAWYDSQRSGRSTHSPRSCLPGGGWRMTQFAQLSLPQIAVGSQPLRVNRALIELGASKQVVYYWFQQRGRVITNEYLVKWYLFWDALTRRRTDGALVRLTSPLRPGETVEAADRRLGQFAALLGPQLERYIPN